MNLRLLLILFLLILIPNGAGSDDANSGSVTAPGSLFTDSGNTVGFISEAAKSSSLPKTSQGLERASYERKHLRSALSYEWFTIRSSLPLRELKHLAAILRSAHQAFFNIFGPVFKAPVQGDPNENLSLFLFATKREYDEFMKRYIGYGHGSGGLYIERDGSLYTFQRSARQSAFSLKELLQHEVTHYLLGRYVYPGVWGDKDYFSTPRGWSDEGLAELIAGLELQDTEEVVPQSRPQHLKVLCRAPRPNIELLLSRRDGYDIRGTFDYTGAWALVHFLLNREKEALINVYAAMRDGRYQSADFPRLAGFNSLQDAERAWHDAIDAWCENTMSLPLHP